MPPLGLRASLLLHYQLWNLSEELITTYILLLAAIIRQFIFTHSLSCVGILSFILLFNIHYLFFWFPLLQTLVLEFQCCVFQIKHVVVAFAIQVLNAVFTCYSTDRFVCAGKHSILCFLLYIVRAMLVGFFFIVRPVLVV